MIPLKLLLLLFCTLPLFCKAQADCGENANAKEKLFVFIGQKIEVVNLSSEKDRNDTKFLATYKILEKICGDFLGDTITFEVISTLVDSTFKFHENTLFFLTRNVFDNTDYQLWHNTCYDVYKTKDGRWASPMKTGDHVWSRYISSYPGLTRKIFLTSLSRKIKPSKIQFDQEVWYDITGMTKEQVDFSYPDLFYKIERQKAIAVYGNYVSQLFNIQKRGSFKHRGLYGKPDYYKSNLPDVALSPYIEPTEGEKEQQKLEADSILAINLQTLKTDPFSDSLIGEIYRHYKNEDDFEGYAAYFDDLVVQYPDSINAYLTKARYRHIRPNLEDSSKISVLLEGLKIDNRNYELNYQLAICYYDLFLNYPNPHYAWQARQWFIRSAEIDTIERAFLKYPMIQLSNYLLDTTLVARFKTYQSIIKTNDIGVPTGNRYNWYFPYDSFLDVEKTWETDYGINFIQKKRHTAFIQDWFSESLLLFNEPLLTLKNHDVYRFQWLRYLSKPIAIRFERRENNVMLYWKRPKYNSKLDIYEPDQDGQKKLSLKQWNAFEKKLERVDFWSMVPIDHYKSGATHGDTWIFEGYVNSNYKVVERSSESYPLFINALYYLIKKSNLKFK